MHPKEISRLVLAELEERGWVQGSSYDPDTGGVCLTGAAYFALGRDLAKDIGTFHGESANDYVRRMGFWDWIHELRHFTVVPIVDWNDNPSRTYEDVALLLKRHAAGDLDGEE